MRACEPSTAIFVWLTCEEPGAVALLLADFCFFYSPVLSRVMCAGPARHRLPIDVVHPSRLRIGSTQSDMIGRSVGRGVMQVCLQHSAV